MPESLVPAGDMRRLKSRTVRPASALAGLSNNAPRFDDALHSLQVIIGAALLIPRTSRRRRGYLPKPSTWIVFCNRLWKLTDWVIRNKPSSQFLFAHLTTEDCAEAVRGTSRDIGWTVSEITKLKSLNQVADWPDLSLNLNDVYGLVGLPEKIRRLTPGGTVVNKRGLGSSERRRYQPLPDAFVTESGWRVLWFVEHLGPNLLPLAEALGKGEETRPKEDQRSGCDLESTVRRGAGFVLNRRTRVGADQAGAGRLSG